jgi:hypothetical protein
MGQDGRQDGVAGIAIRQVPARGRRRMMESRASQHPSFYAPVPEISLETFVLFVPFVVNTVI